MVRSWCVALTVLMLTSTFRIQAQTAARSDVLRDMDGAIQALTAHVAPSVVQILVTGYRAVEEPNRSEAGLVIGRQRSLGSGAIIDSDGYIITNAHVIAGAQQVRVILHAAAVASGPLQSLAEGESLPATVVGIAKDIDLALLKIDRNGLQALHFADYDGVRQGQLVFAFGSPDGLRNSVTMGVISSAARQVDPDSSGVYIQTDAPINPGNSGGPLVNVRGELVGLNTFILTESGGSQGLGFAIPSVAIAAAYPQLKKYGHLHRSYIGINVQAITPTLADGLSLPRQTGVLVSDVTPGLPADMAGVLIGDIIAAIDGRALDNVPLLELALNTKKAGEAITLTLIRGTQQRSATVSVIERPQKIDQIGDLSDVAKSGVNRLGMLGLDVDDSTKPLLPALRIPSGVLVTARREEADTGNPLMTGDVIHGFNGIMIRSLDGLRVLLDGIKAGTPIVLQIERDGRLTFVSMSVR